MLSGGLAALGCATSRSPAAGGAAAPPAATAAPAPGAGTATSPPAGGLFQSMLGRESSGLTIHAVEFPGGKLSGKVESAAAPTVKRQDNAWALTIPIGSEAPISCFVQDKGIDTAASLLRFVRLVKDGATGVTVQGVAPTDAGVIAESAYMMIALSYTKPSPRGLAGGQVKVMVRPDADAPLLCFHDEVGYGETFKRVTRSLAGSLKAQQPSAPPQFVEIQIARLGGVPVGFDRRTVNTDLHGVKLDQTISCMLLPRSPLELSGSDRVVSERSDVHGRVLQIDSVEVEGEELSSQLQLTRNGIGREYVFKGKQSGKEISGHFRSKEKEGLASSILVADRLRSTLLSGKSPEIKVEEYHAGLSPQPLEVTYRRKGDGRGITLMLGQLEAHGRLDESGIIDQVSMPIGGTSMQQERVLIRGTP
jgi:hypothetical protein